jgi:sigma-B regulation protein RsbU (phosphoserine phosphatase)
MKNEEIAKAAGEPIKVLLAEDNPMDAMMIRAVLGWVDGATFEIDAFDRLGAAIERAKAVSFDVMLLDLGLLDAQGLNTFVHAHTELPGVPIVVLSGLADEQVAMQAVHKGAQDYLLKGPGMKDLLPRALRYAIERHHGQQKLERYTCELQEKNATIEEELRLAREVQQALLPQQYPHFSDLTSAHGRALQFAHRYCPATALSGDFFNILPISDHVAGVLICDVMGHGVRAAFIGALARGFILQFTPIASDPGRFLTSLNHALTETLKQSGIEAFASAFYFVADVASQQMRYANAGHPSALMLRRDAGVVEWLQVERPFQPPLGLLENTTYPESRTVLSERDSIVLYTDGLYEQENAAGEQFGHQRLLDAVAGRLREPCYTLLDELVKETQQFSGQIDFADDVCLVGMDVVDGTATGRRAA